MKQFFLFLVFVLINKDSFNDESYNISETLPPLHPLVEHDKDKYFTFDL